MIRVKKLKFASNLRRLLGMDDASITVTHGGKALSATSVTENGSATSCKELQPLKASAPITVTESGIVSFVNALQS